MDDHALTRRVLDLWDFNDPGTSAERFGEAASATDDETTRQVLLTQLARARGLQGDIAVGDAILDGLGETTALATEPAIRVLLERGRLRNSDGDPDASVALFTEAYERATAAGRIGLAADAAHMLAIVLPPEQHDAWAERGVALASGSDDPLARRMIGTLLNNLGWTYADRGDWAGALALFDRALQARREQDDPIGVHVAQWTRARALRALGRGTEALALLHELAATPEGADDPYVAEEIAANEGSASQ